MRVVFAVLLLWIPSLLAGQPRQSNQFNTLFPAKLWERPVLDSTIQISRLSRELCYRLIEKMFVVDQQYRDSLQRYKPEEAKFREFIRLMTINDPVNQTILLKILKRYGWPCDDTKRQLSFKAWIIAWHARSDFDKMHAFYPYLAEANQRKCIHYNHFAEFRERYNAIEKMRGQWVLGSF